MLTVHLVYKTTSGLYIATVKSREEYLADFVTVVDYTDSNPVEIVNEMRKLGAYGESTRKVVEEPTRYFRKFLMEFLYSKGGGYVFFHQSLKDYGLTSRHLEKVRMPLDGFIVNPVVITEEKSSKPPRRAEVLVFQPYFLPDGVAEQIEDLSDFKKAVGATNLAEYDNFIMSFRDAENLKEELKRELPFRVNFIISDDPEIRGVVED